MIHKSLWLPCDAARAFAIFTREAGHWWPVDRRHTSDRASEIVFEPMGRFFERAHDGHLVELGRVLTWDPPNSLVFTFFLAQMWITRAASQSILCMKARAPAYR